MSYHLSSLILFQKNRAKRDKIISDVRYEEQRKQYEERLDEERRRREEDKRVAEEKLRVSEQPYFVFKNSKAVSNSNSESTILCMEFLNKGQRCGILYNTRLRVYRKENGSVGIYNTSL